MFVGIVVIEVVDDGFDFLGVVLVGILDASFRVESAVGGWRPV